MAATAAAMHANAAAAVAVVAMTMFDYASPEARREGVPCLAMVKVEMAAEVVAAAAVRSMATAVMAAMPRVVVHCTRCTRRTCSSRTQTQHHCKRSASTLRGTYRRLAWASMPP